MTPIARSWSRRSARSVVSHNTTASTRLFAWPRRPRHRFELAAVLGELAGDIVRLVPALCSAGRRVEWRRLVKVTRTHPVPDTAQPVVVDGEAVAGEILRTWRALDAAPAPRDSGHKVRT